MNKQCTPSEYSCLGVLSDTHGFLPNSVLEIFSGRYSSEQLISRHRVDPDVNTSAIVPICCGLIAHAGDIGNADSIDAQLIIDALEAVSPVVAVLGNCDYPIYSTAGGKIKRYATFTYSGVSFAMLHKPKELACGINGDGALRPAYIRPKPQVGIHGHTHIQKIDETGNMLTICPGSTTRSKKGQRESVMVMYLAREKVLAVDLVAV